MTDNPSAHIGTLYVYLFIESAQSLKDKRAVVKKLKDKVRSSFNVSISEIDKQDKWQMAVLGFSMIGNDNRYMNSALEKLLAFIETNHAVRICGHCIEFS